MSEIKIAKPDHPVHDLIARRWSPYAFSDRPVPQEDLNSIFEAARWAASSYNEQPWRYILAQQQNEAEFARMLSCLLEANRGWAQQAPALALGVVGLNFARNEKPNRVAVHDLGLASANLTLEATARGLVVHQMAGIDPEKARQVYSIPEGFEAITALAIGYVGNPESLPENMRARDQTPRPRRPLSEIIFRDEWNRSAF
jgi:nitroreductase